MADTLTAKKKADRMEEWIWVSAKGICLIFYMLVPHPERKKILVAQLCPTHCDPRDCSPPSSFVHGILQARILEWIAVPFSRGSSQPWDRTHISCMAGRFFITSITHSFTMNIIIFYCMYCFITNLSESCHLWLYLKSSLQNTF